jgi:hypothetical protein
MEVEYHLTFDDVLAFERHAQKQLPKIAPPKMRGPWALAHYVIVGVISLLIASFYLELIGPPGATLPFLLGLAMGVIWFFFLALGWGRGKLRSLRECFEEGHARWALAPRRLIISPEGVRFVNYYSDSTSRWDHVWQISVSKDHAFLFITPLQAHIVPRRAFADRRVFEAFVALARQYHEGRWPLPAQLPRSEGITTSPTPSIPEVLPYDTP